ncbi:M56 family metallopeptidase [Actibacterium sp. 188UL27-1]|uniref:M56 family metallopeptidase n=1 Tax=Actibacterium sp. 188UL27-1 TaxID=2786961 RepID=UPI00195847DB|nr:M56 family metallopeptidase [Actibacterium sp. 188UL27-1]MBM7067171.1 M56 family metallopeptidase [Actibacterium sp. 188UL27-1]
MNLRGLIDLIVDANVAFALLALGLVLAEGLFWALGHGRAYAARRRLMIAVFAGLLVLPLVPMVGRWMAYPAQANVTDLLVAQYLKGNISMSATDFVGLLSWRHEALSVLDRGMSQDGAVLMALAVLAILTTRACFVAFSMASIAAIIARGAVIRRMAGVTIVVDDQVRIPFSTRGLRSYFIVVPQALLTDPATLKIAIGHELQHIRQGDIECEIVSALLSPIFILNPAFWLMSRKWRRLREYTCDIHYLGRSGCNAKLYATSLLRVARQAKGDTSRGVLDVLSVPFVGRAQVFAGSARSRLAERIGVIADGAAPRPHLALQGVVAAGLFALVAVGGMSFQKPPSWSHDRIMLRTVATLEHLEQMNGLAVRSSW